MSFTPTVFELRNYTLHPGRRDELIALFEREFIEAQQDCGITLPGLFTDMDRPDRFVWLRGFFDMAARPEALARFYTGPVWQQHRTAANATMINSDDVLLLKPFGAPVPKASGAGRMFVCVDCVIQTEADATAIDAVLTANLDGELVGRWITDPTPNNFPRLPVREGERHAVWLLRVRGDFDAAMLAPWTPQVLRLQPTTRSALQLDAAPRAFVGRPGDFDFLVGRWAVRNTRLMTRLQGNTTDWREFHGVQQAWSHMGGQISFDELSCESEGFAGATMRTLDMATKQWAIYWVNSRTGKLYPPVHGGWCGDRGEFYGIEEDSGHTALVRFVWERLGTDAARWTQAYSIDGGRSWENNWRMDFTRLA
ncbi:NIPSNAP family protein [Paucibacter sp. R3-3]|uniref:NIPSNAP family protein n=1 Tax=Roseateles agri TaxID=3098619 RepID=A0ABU5D9Q0_9BURK|nr:NIPSNAP family protein [Paucibacter sp. R3-3]MDY0742869.1 NIPSNAP family protein [Paucibacter sp. R3-3]